MAELQWTIEGRRFRSREEYQAALRDKELIDAITGELKLDDPKDIEKLYMKLKNGKYEFETIVGRQFDDNIYELYKQIQTDKLQKAESERLHKEKRKQEIEKVKNTLKYHKKSGKSEKSTVRLEDMDKDMQKEVMLILKKKERKRKLIMAACVLLCVVSFGYLGAYYQVSAKSAREFEELAALKQAGANSLITAKNDVKIHYTEDSEVPDVLPEYQNLLNKNQRLIGWIKIDDTIIDYPVMQTVNNEYYLDHNFNQEEDNNGCIFMDYQCDVVKGCDNMILYGHHMKSGKMFGTLNKYSQKSYYEEHPVIKFDTIYEKGEYQVMYVFRSKVYSEEDVNFKYYQFINAGSEKEFNSYINEMAALSLYDTGVTASYGDKLLTLSTCDYQEKEGRFVVVAKRTA